MMEALLKQAMLDEYNGDDDGWKKIPDRPLRVTRTSIEELESGSGCSDILPWWGEIKPAPIRRSPSDGTNRARHCTRMKNRDSKSLSVDPDPVERNQHANPIQGRPAAFRCVQIEFRIQPRPGIASASVPEGVSFRVSNFGPRQAWIEGRSSASVSAREGHADEVDPIPRRV